MATTIIHRSHPVMRDFWERYTEFPDLYDRFAVSSVRAVQELDEMLAFTGTRVLDMASGTGRAAFEMARLANHVVGVEPNDNMRTFAIQKQRSRRVDNVEFVAGVAEDLSSFGTGVFDRVVSVHGAPFEWDDRGVAVRESLRVVKQDGWVAFVSAPDPSGLRRTMAPFGFEFREVDVEIDFGSVEEALATWGCVHGEEAIDHLLDTQTSKVTLGFGIWYRRA